MSTLIELTGLVDRREFDEGEWDSEPDLLIWRDKVTDLICAVVRTRPGTLCGYVALPENHPARGQDFCGDIVGEYRVHGGVTFAAPTPFIGWGMPVADLAAKLCDDAVDWWIGFDCAHAWDLVPSRSYPDYLSDQQYRRFEYVKRQTEALAEQVEVMPWEVKS